MGEVRPLTRREVEIRAEFLAAASIAVAKLVARGGSAKRDDQAVDGSGPLLQKKNHHLPSSPLPSSSKPHHIDCNSLRTACAKTSEYLSLLHIVPSADGTVTTGESVPTDVTMKENEAECLPLRKQRNKRRRAAKRRFRQLQSPGFHECVVPTPMSAIAAADGFFLDDAPPVQLREQMSEVETSLLSQLSASFGSKLLRLSTIRSGGANLCLSLLFRRFCRCCGCFLVRGRTARIFARARGDGPDGEAAARIPSVSLGLRCQRCAQRVIVGRQSSTQKRCLASVIARVHLARADRILSARRAMPRTRSKNSSSKNVKIFARVTWRRKRRAERMAAARTKALPSAVQHRNAAELATTPWKQQHSAASPKVSEPKVPRQSAGLIRSLFQSTTSTTAVTTPRRRISVFKGGSATPSA